jgi:hypothetical protein
LLAVRRSGEQQTKEGKKERYFFTFHNLRISLLGYSNI